VEDAFHHPATDRQGAAFGFHKALFPVSRLLPPRRKPGYISENHKGFFVSMYAEFVFQITYTK
jgi:hypothetical protein